MCKQLSNYFDTISYQFHCAFRKGHECHTALVVLLENGKHALDCNEYVAAISMDLSNAFECLPHKILLSKFSAYDLSEKAVLLSRSYVSDRKQQIEISTVVSSCVKINKGVNFSSPSF